MHILKRDDKLISKFIPGCIVEVINITPANNIISVYIRKNNTSGWKETWMLDHAHKSLERGDYVLVNDNGE